MSNPFETIDTRLTTIESILLDIRNQQTDLKSPANKTDDEILNVKQASEFLKLAVPTIYSLTSNRTIPHSKRGKKLYFSKIELIAWVQSGKRLCAAELKTKAKSFTTIKS